MRSLAKQRAWPALAYDGSKQLFAPSRAIEEAHRKDGITIPVHRPADLEGGNLEDVFRVRSANPRSSVRPSPTRFRTLRGELLDSAKRTEPPRIKK
jgi:hypothetical protein